MGPRLWVLASTLFWDSGPLQSCSGTEAGALRGLWRRVDRRASDSLQGAVVKD